MNWEDEQFVKVYTRDTGEWTLLSWDAQALLLQILRKVDRSGVLQLGKHGARVLPAALGHRDQGERITAALQELTADGCVVVREGCLVVPNFIAAQTSRQSDKARQQSARDRRRAESMGAGLPSDRITSQNVTDCHLASPDVTSRHPESPRVTLDKNRQEEIRSEEKRTEEGLPKPPAAPAVLETPAALVLTGSEAKPARTRKARKPADPMPGTIILGAYTEAFMGRYKVAPPVDNRTRKHFANIARNAIVGRAETVSEQAAIQEACGVAARYVGHPNAYYAQQSHPPSLLDRDWHKLVTEYRTGRTVTATTARDHERTASNPILEFAAEVRAHEEEARRRKAEVINVDE